MGGQLDADPIRDPNARSPADLEDTEGMVNRIRKRNEVAGIGSCEVTNVAESRERYPAQRFHERRHRTPAPSVPHSAQKGPPLGLALVMEVREAADRILAAPHRGEKRDDILPGFRRLTIERATYWFDIDDERRAVRVLAVFVGGQDQVRRMLTRLLDT